MDTSTVNRKKADDLASSIIDTECLADGIGAVSPHLKYPHNALQSEAVADFKALNGYWNRIIVRDMVAQGSAFLPDLFIG